MVHFISEYVTSAFDYLGVVLYAIGVLAIIIVAFEKGLLWGFGMLIFGGILWPIFVLFNWNKTSYWFFFALTGFLIVYIF